MSRDPYDRRHDCLRHMEEREHGPDECRICGQPFRFRMLIPRSLQDEFACLSDDEIREAFREAVRKDGRQHRQARAG